MRMVIKNLFTREQIKSMRTVTLFGYIPWVLLYLLMGILVVQEVVGSARELMSDPYLELDVPLHFGLFSNMSAFLWCAAMTTCFFAANFLAGRQRQFLFASGVLSLILLVDDFYMIHEFVFPNYLGISQNMVFLILIILFLIYAFRFRDNLLDTPYLQLILALGFLGSAAIMDNQTFLSIISQIFPFLSQNTIIGVIGAVEEGVEILGIIGWAAYYIQVSARSVQEATRLNDSESSSQ